VCEVPLITYCAASVRYWITVSFGCGKYLCEKQKYCPRNGYVLNHNTFGVYLQKVELKVCNGIFYLPSATKLKNLALCVGHIAAIQKQNVRTCAEKMKVCFVQFTFHVMTISFLCLRNQLQIMFKNLPRLIGVFHALSA
jgi:hypothetical protein